MTRPTSRKVIWRNPAQALFYQQGSGSRGMRSELGRTIGSIEALEHQN
jgi:hypothetical protein